MSDLDEKLRDIDKFVMTRIMREPTSDESRIVDMRLTLTDAVIADIKQAFTDSGYVQIPQVEVVTRWERSDKAELFMVNGKEVMTGQEWHDRFTTETLGQLFEYRTDREQELVRDTAHFFMKAAKRASGIKE